MADALEKDDNIGHIIGVRWGKMLAQSMSVMEVAGRAHEVTVDDKGQLEKPPGMSDADFNIVKASWCDTKHAPFWLHVHQKRLELAHRIAGDRTNAPAKIAEVVVRVSNATQREYPVIDVKVKDK